MSRVYCLLVVILCVFLFTSSSSGIAPSEVGRVELVTSARFFNYAFNPVNFYFCYRPATIDVDGDSLVVELIRCIVAEVSNTFGERHVYVLDDRCCSKRAKKPGFMARFTCPKAVSECVAGCSLEHEKV